MISTGRQKQIDLASSVGAGIIGVALGAWQAGRLYALLPFLFVAGIALHGWGMIARRLLEREGGIQLPRWASALYWTCWALIAAMGFYIAFGGFR